MAVVQPGMTTTQTLTTTIVRYRVKPGRGPENAELVRAVYAELAETAPDDFRYATYVSEDGESFTHVARFDGGDTAPLTSLAAFKRFREGLDERCAEGPSNVKNDTVGSYGF